MCGHDIVDFAFNHQILSFVSPVCVQEKKSPTSIQFTTCPEIQQRLVLAAKGVKTAGVWPVWHCVWQCQDQIPPDAHTRDLDPVSPAQTTAQDFTRERLLLLLRRRVWKKGKRNEKQMTVVEGFLRTAIKGNLAFFCHLPTTGLFYRRCSCVNVQGRKRKSCMNREKKCDITSDIS